MKGKFPFLSRAAKKEDKEDEVGEDSSYSKDSTDIEEYDEVAQPKWKQVLSKQLPFLAKILNKSPARSSVSGDKTDVGVKIPSATDQRQKIIRIVLLLGGLYFVYDSFLNPTEEATETVEEVATNPQPKKKKKRPRPVEPVATAPVEPVATAPVEPVATAPVEPVATAPVEPVATAPVEPVATAPVEPVATAPVEPVATAPVEPVATAPVEPVAAAPVEALPPVERVDIPIETVGDDSPIPEDSAPIEATAPEEVVEKVPDLIPPDLEPSPTIPSDESTTGGESASGTDQVVEGQTPEDNPDMTEQILKDLEKQIQEKKADMPAAGAPYIDPPEYENFGRGLVYNCRGKHWACVDGGSYQVCQQNYSSLKGTKKSKECYPDSVFQTEKACVWMQKERITSSTKTDFCQ